MRYVDILAKFFEFFPSYQEKVYRWAPKEKHTIILDVTNGPALGFTYYNDNEWTLESTNPKNRRV